MVSTEAVLVISSHAGRSRKLARARRALDKDTIVVAEEREIGHLERLPELLRTRDGKARLVIAAGGDGTVGSVAGRLAGAENPLGILPLGTGNDFARSLGIPLNPRRAARLLGTGDISRVDLGRLTRPPGPRGTSPTPRPSGPMSTSPSWPLAHRSAVASGASPTWWPRSMPSARTPHSSAPWITIASPTSWTCCSSR
jgi:Diacylglycerol kinase catalytic domain